MCFLHKTTRNLVLAALFLALGLVLPLLTGQIPQFGQMMLPMHLPVLLCGLICGWQYGLPVGLILPPLRYAIFGMPPIFPTGAAMAFELAAYGFLAGWVSARLGHGSIGRIYAALLAAMVGGRVVWGVVSAILYGVAGNPFTWKLFFSGAVLTAIPGIVLQLVLIPALVLALTRAGFLPRPIKAGETTI